MFTAMQRILLASAFLLGVLSSSCANDDPELNPEPTQPPTSSRQLPWNTPQPGQGGGQLGTLPNQRLRR